MMLKEDENKILREALEYYADPINWDENDILNKDELKLWRGTGDDGFEFAQEILKGLIRRIKA